MHGPRRCKRLFGAVFIKEAQEGEYRLETVVEGEVLTGYSDAGGALVFADEGEDWVPVLRGDFDKANAAYFSVWALERSCSSYAFEAGRMRYEVKAVISDPPCIG